MQENKERTLVEFYRPPEGGEVLALFPLIPYDGGGVTVMSYQHTGQHGAADPAITRGPEAWARLAPTEPDAVTLAEELRRIGYTLELGQTIDSDKERTDTMRETILEAMADTLFASKYADAIESGECFACGARDANADLELDTYIQRDPLWEGDQCQNCNREYPRAGSGEEWMGAICDLVRPPLCLEWAKKIAASVEAANPGKTLEAIGDEWDKACQPDNPCVEYHWEEEDAERFAHCLAMQSMGHGVGLLDDIASDDYNAPTVPHDAEHFDAGEWDWPAIIGEAPAPDPEAIPDPADAPDPMAKTLTPLEVCKRIASGYYTASRAARYGAICALAETKKGGQA